MTSGMAQKMFAAADEPKQLTIVQGRDHRFEGNTAGFFEPLRESLQWIEDNGRR